jgi:hypothetical protein
MEVCGMSEYTAKVIYNKLSHGQRVKVRARESNIEFEFVPESFDHYPRYSIYRLGGLLHKGIMLLEHETTESFDRFAIIRKR